MKILQSINNVMQSVGYVQMTGENKFHRYKYASEADLINALRDEMVKNQIVFYPHSIVESKIEQVETVNAKGLPSKDSVATIVILYRFQHAEDASHIDVQVASHSRNNGGDKAAFAAMTGALKYALGQTFLLPRGEDPENEQQPTGNTGNKVVYPPFDEKTLERLYPLGRYEIVKPSIMQRYPNLENFYNTKLSELATPEGMKKHVTINFPCVEPYYSEIGEAVKDDPDCTQTSFILAAAKMQQIADTGEIDKDVFIPEFLKHMRGE